MATFDLPINNDDFNICHGDPNGWYCNWTAAGVSFSGTAKSVVFIGPADYIGYDNITIGSAIPALPQVPITNWALLLGILLIGIFIVLRFRKVFA